MYKLIIVDDEYTIRRGLQQYIPWHSLGFEVASVFEDGVSALNYLSDHTVDVVLTDINMPIMNGIKLVQLIREKEYPTKCVVISGYNDFNYAKQLIPFHITDYLLKPINNDEIMTLFSELKTTLDIQYLAMKQAEEEERKVKTMRHALKQQFFSDVFLKKIPSNNILHSLERYGLEFELMDNHVLYAQLHIDNADALLQGSWHYGVDALYDSIVNYLKNLPSDFQLIDFPSGQDSINIVGLSDNSNPLSSNLEAFHSLLQSSIQWIGSISNIKISITKSSGYESLEHLDHMDDTAAIASSITQSSTTVVSSSLVSETEDSELTYFYSAINSAFLERNMDQVYERLDTLYELMRNYLSDDARKAYQSILDILLRQFEDTDEFSSYISGKLLLCDSVHDMSVYVKQCIEKLSQQLSSNPDSQLERLIKQALIYIDEHYQEDISRNDVADYVFLSSSYFSRCFKRVVGVKFIDHLTKLRIQKSCELLMDCNNKISDVCEQVGYNSPSYFTRVFKCTMGITPNEYIRANILH